MSLTTHVSDSEEDNSQSPLVAPPWDHQFSLKLVEGLFMTFFEILPSWITEKHTLLLKVPTVFKSKLKLL
jgi:hypothetical protein